MDLQNQQWSCKLSGLRRNSKAILLSVWHPAKMPMGRQGIRSGFHIHLVCSSTCSASPSLAESPWHEELQEVM